MTMRSNSPRWPSTSPVHLVLVVDDTESVVDFYLAQGYYPNGDALDIGQVYRPPAQHLPKVTIMRKQVLAYGVDEHTNSGSHQNITEIDTPAGPLGVITEVGQQSEPYVTVVMDLRKDAELFHRRAS